MVSRYDIYKKLYGIYKKIGPLQKITENHKKMQFFTFNNCEIINYKWTTKHTYIHITAIPFDKGKCKSSRDIDFGKVFVDVA